MPLADAREDEARQRDGRVERAPADLPEAIHVHELLTDDGAAGWEKRAIEPGDELPERLRHRVEVPAAVARRERETGEPSSVTARSASAR